MYPLLRLPLDFSKFMTIVLPDDPPPSTIIWMLDFVYTSWLRLSCWHKKGWTAKLVILSHRWYTSYLGMLAGLECTLMHLHKRLDCIHCGNAKWFVIWLKDVIIWAAIEVHSEMWNQFTQRRLTSSEQNSLSGYCQVSFRSHAIILHYKWSIWAATWEIPSNYSLCNKMP